MQLAGGAASQHVAPPLKVLAGAHLHHFWLFGWCLIAPFLLLFGWCSFAPFLLLCASGFGGYVLFGFWGVIGFFVFRACPYWDLLFVRRFKVC